MMNVLVNLFAEVTTVWDPRIHYLRIVVKPHQQPLQPPQPLQQLQPKVIVFTGLKLTI